MPSNNLRNIELEFTPTLVTQLRLSTRIYFYKVKSSEYTLTGKLILIK